MPAGGRRPTRSCCPSPARPPPRSRLRGCGPEEPWQSSAPHVTHEKQKTGSIGGMTTPLQRVAAANLRSPAGPYSPGISTGQLVFVSGQVGRDPVSGRVADGVEAQTEQTLKN